LNAALPAFASNPASYRTGHSEWPSLREYWLAAGIKAVIEGGKTRMRIKLM